MSAHSFRLADLVALTFALVITGVWATGCVTEVREAGRRTACMNNQRQVAMAMNNYDTAVGHFPGWKNTLGGKTTTFVPPILYLVERSDLYDLWKDGKQTAAHIRMLWCPSNPPDSLAPSDSPLAYCVNAGKVGAVSPQAFEGVCFDLTDSNQPRVSTSFLVAHDGLAFTLLLGEKLPPRGEWANFTWATPEPDVTRVGFQWDGGAKPSTQIASKHAGGSNVTFCDGHVHFLRDNLDPLVFAHLMTPDGTRAGLPGSLQEGSY